MSKQGKERQAHVINSSSKRESEGRGWGESEGEELLIRLVESFDEVYKVKEWMVTLGEANNGIHKSKIFGETFFISGPAQSGKASLVYWALRYDPDPLVVTVDCSIYHTVNQFIQRLTKGLGEKIGVRDLDQRVVANETINFGNLNRIIQEHGRPVVILIRHVDRLVETREQALLYNLLEWEGRKMVGLVFTTRLILLAFFQRLEQRVKSRLDGSRARHLTVVQPDPEHILGLLVRRVECLLDESQVKSAAQRFYEKVIRCMHKNEKLKQVIAASQEVAHPDIVYYLNATKLAFSSFPSAKEIMAMSDPDLINALCQHLRNSFQFIFPSIPINMLKTCTFSEYVIMAVISHMIKRRMTLCFKNIYCTYLEFRQRLKQRLQAEERYGRSLMYSKNVLENAVLKLEEVKLIELDRRDEPLWSCDIKCNLYPEDIIRAMKEVEEESQERLPYLLQQILQS